ncbi:MAG: hypothetical protein M1835_006356 [Candelina submexicana]|nr:MAG: hypothetical protein M1835_006356 [Candelina submexicana]
MPPRLFSKVFGVFFISVLWLLWSSRAEKTAGNSADGVQRPLRNPESAKRIAIIGAGSGGSSAAYYLKRYATGAGINTNITVFERSAYVGGRSTTVNVYNDPSEPVEVGASIFVEVNKNLVAAAEAFGLSIQAPTSVRSQEASDQLGVWNGEKFVFTQSEGGYQWWNIAKLLWKYGWAPLRTQNLMKQTVDTFLKMYEAPYFPFRSLSDTAFDLGLTPVTSSTGEQFLAANKIHPPFSTDIIQASTRVNYGQNLGLIHGLETMVCMAAEGAMAIRGGNWQIFDGMLKAAGANVQLDMKVTKIERNDDGKYTVESMRTRTSSKSEKPLSEEYDTVIIASPLQFSDIELIPAPSNSPHKIPYVQLHVTLFTSPHRISPQAFNLSHSTLVPQMILTTLKPNEHPASREAGVGSTGFFSISTQRKVTNPSTDPPSQEYLYKIFSPTPVNSTFLARLLDLPAPSTPDSDLPDEDISWRADKLWYSYPYLYPRITFDDIQLDRGLWYTSGIESFISTMETSSLMGMNVGRLIADDWLGVTN